MVVKTKATPVKRRRAPWNTDALLGLKGKGKRHQSTKGTKDERVKRAYLKGLAHCGGAITISNDGLICMNELLHKDLNRVAACTVTVVNERGKKMAEVSDVNFVARTFNLNLSGRNTTHISPIVKIARRAPKSRQIEAEAK
jgi:hypothetical protein